ncbi:MAG: tRNA 2-thiouridine(34) synthase MnmA [Verrucomicrobiota bacterium]
MQPNLPRVVIGMSGGVDSSVAAYLLKEQGYDVVGMTMKVWLQDCIAQAQDACCGPSAVADARAVAHAIGIPHYVLDESADFNQTIVGYFAAEYAAGRTPNPCILCNEKVKFGSLWNKAASLGAAFLATGHYARVEQEGAGGRFVLRKGADARKDQSYFLFSLSQEQLGRTLFPLGGMSKPEIRAIARRIGLKVADKADSQEICFVPGNDYKAFLRQRLGEGAFHPGGIYDTSGKRLADHQGIEFFTIGQRKGLPGGSPRPLYVVDIDPGTGAVIVGGAEDLAAEAFRIERCNWLDGESSASLEVTVKIRHGHPGAEATVTPLENGAAEVRLHVPQRAVTPGQAAVCYAGDRVLGGGWITRRV